MTPQASTPRNRSRGPAPRSGPRRPREQVLAEQRLRLMAAMIDSVGQNGYRSTTVADVSARARVSRKTFYEHFANKQECFLATYDLVSAEGMRRVQHAYRETEGWPERVQAAIRALFEAAIENPGAVRLSMVEIGALGPAGIERREDAIVAYERFIRDALGLASVESPPTPAVDTALKAVVGGLRTVLYRGVLRGEHAELLAVIPDLVTWATSYYPPAQAIVSAPPSGAVSDPRTRPAPDGGRAPGTLAPHPPLSGRRGLPRGDQNVSHSFVVHSQRERILDAVANLTAAKGYAAVGVDDIAEEAAVSLKAFYEHFEDKEDAFLVAYELGHSKGLAIAERAYTAQDEWPQAVRAGIAALFNFLAAEPSFAHIALVDALVATPRTAERSSAGVSAFARMLVPGLEEAPGHARPAAVTIEAIAGGIFELCLHCALQGRIHELSELAPRATYFALAPFVGSEQAAHVATTEAVG